MKNQTERRASERNYYVDAIQCAAWKQCLITEEKDGKEKRENGKNSCAEENAR